MQEQRLYKYNTIINNIINNTVINIYYYKKYIMLLKCRSCKLYNFLNNI